MRLRLIKTCYVPVIIFLSVITGFALQGFQYLPESDDVKSISDFNLKNVDGKYISLKDFPSAKGFIIVFTCNHCPFAKLYTDRLNELNTRFKSLDVPLLAINSMDTVLYKDECFDRMQDRSKSQGFNFPYLQDEDQSVGKNFGAEHTPHAYVIWKENNKWIIRYSGAIDDNGEEPEKAKPYIANAVNDLLKGKEVEEKVTSSVGCRIFYRK